VPPDFGGSIAAALVVADGLAGSACQPIGAALVTLALCAGAY